MEPILTILLLLILIGLIALFVAKPFISGWRPQAEVPQENSALLAERDHVLTALEELDSDHILGKIPEEEYPVQRAALLQKGADILRQLDEFQAAHPAPIPARKKAKSTANQPKGTSGAKPVSDDELEDLIAKRRAVHKEKAAGFCSKCGKPILKTDVFCPSCGQPVNS